MTPDSFSQTTNMSASIEGAGGNIQMGDALAVEQARLDETTTRRGGNPDANIITDATSSIDASNNSVTNTNITSSRNMDRTRAYAGGLYGGTYQSMESENY